MCNANCGKTDPQILHTLFAGEVVLTPEEEALKSEYQAEWDALQAGSPEAVQK
jgi:hypothetical protein